MKLLANYNRMGLWFTITAILVTGIIYYFSISYILSRQVDQDLATEEKEILDFVKLNGRLPRVLDLEDLKISFKLSDRPVKREFRDAVYYDRSEDETESGRRLISSVIVGNKLYRISIVESKVESDDLVQLISEVTIAVVVALLSGLLILNRIVLRNLWQPFYTMLGEITQFNLAGRSKISKIDTEIDEFKLMNEEITSMANRVIQDYHELQNFTENAAHELMTPLSLVNFKLDNLVQEGFVSEKQGILIDEIYETLARMKRLNKSMLMLARIENRLFTEKESVDVASAVEEALHQFDELLKKREIAVSTTIQSANMFINSHVFPVLLNNLLSNAINHNYIAGGKILITVTKGYLSIVNTGQIQPLDSNAIFQRFYKAPGSEGTGLGLTLVKEICESFSIGLEYGYHQGLHIFELKF